MGNRSRSKGGGYKHTQEVRRGLRNRWMEEILHRPTRHVVRHWRGECLSALEPS